MLALALLQTFVVALALGLPLYVALRLACFYVRAAVARAISNALDLCFTLKGCLRDK